jgi:hypothetical protein
MAYLEETNIDQALVLEFFMKFSRFEFALKLTGFARGNENYVEPAWRRFMQHISNSFDKNHTRELEKACEYFLVNPPHQQVLIGNTLGWNRNIPNNTNSEPELIIELVKRVRNNLFHDGKYNAEIHEETARSEELLRNALIIL